jgi:TonB family protein
LRQSCYLQLSRRKSSDSEKADANALAAVKQWRFKPAMKDGVPVAVPINIQVDARRH